MTGRLRAIALVSVSAVTAGFAGYQDPPIVDKPTPREAELLKDLVEAVTVGISEAVEGYSGFLAGLKAGKLDEKVWLPFARRKALEYLDRGRMLTADPDQNQKRVTALVDQLAEITSALTDSEVGLLMACDQGLTAEEGHLILRLSSVGTALGEIMKKHVKTVKTAGIDLAKLETKAKQMMELIKTRSETAKRMKTIKLVTVVGNKQWQDTEIKVREGEKVTVAAIGFVSGGSSGQMSPLGIDHYKDDRVVKDAFYGSLIARQEGMEKGFYKIGLKGGFEADRTGLLFLMPNYIDLQNKGGYFQAIVLVEKRQKRDDDE